MPRRKSPSSLAPARKREVGGPGLDIEQLLAEREQNLAEIEALRDAHLEVEVSQQLYAELFDFAPVGYVNLTAKGQIETANLMAAELLETTPQQLTGQYFGGFVEGSDRIRFIDHLRKCRQAGAHDVSTELKLFDRRSRTIRVVEMLSRPTTLGDADRVVFRTLLRDVTARRETETALALSESRFQAMAELGSDGVCVFDSAAKITYVSPNVRAILGYREREVVGRKICGLVHADDQLAARGALRRILCTETAEIRELRHRVRDKKGIWRWIEYSLANFSGNPAIGGVMCNFREVTASKGVEDALAVSEERLRLIVENAREYAIVSLDLERNITGWNVGAEAILGYAGHEVLGKSADLIFTPEDRAAGAPEKEATLALRTGKASDERWHQRKDGSRFWGSGMMVAMRAEHGAIVGLAKIFRDQTAERRSKEELEAALAEATHARAEAEAAIHAKDRFLAVLSHELRTPLTPITMATYMLLRQPGLPKLVFDAVQMIQRNVATEAQFVDDLLEVTRIAHGKLELTRSLVDLHDVIHRAIEVCRSEAEAKNQKMKVTLRARRRTVLGEDRRLQQVVWNLLRNASKFTPESGQISVRTRNVRPGRIVLEVVDTGIGIEPGELPRIFEAFSQASESITREFGGLGLGLAIAKAFVIAHGGEISVKSEGRGRGAAFSVWLPLADEEAAPPV